MWQFLEDYNRLIWVDPRLVTKLRQLQQAINGVMTGASLDGGSASILAGAVKEKSSAGTTGYVSCPPPAQKERSPNCGSTLLRELTVEVEVACGLQQQAVHFAESPGGFSSEGNGLHTPQLEALVREIRRIATEHDLDVASQQRADCWSMGEYKPEQHCFRPAF